MRCTAILCGILVSLAPGMAQAVILDGNNGQLAGQVGWTVTAGQTITITVKLTPEGGDPAKLSGGDFGVNISGPDTSWVKVSALGGTRTFDFSAAGFLFSGGSQYGDVGLDTPNAEGSVSTSPPYVDFTGSTSAFQFDLSVPGNAAGGQYTLDFNTANLAVYDNLALTPPVHVTSGLLEVQPVPEPGTIVALASGGMCMAGSLWYRSRRRKRAKTAARQPVSQSPAFSAPASQPTGRRVRRVSRSGR